MTRPVDETEWLTRATKPLRLARFVQTRLSTRKLQIISCAACRLVAQHLRRDDVRRELDVAERFAFGDATAEEYATAISPATAAIRRTHRQYGEEISPAIAAGRAVASAGVSNVVAGMVRTIEWVLMAGPDDPALPAAVCDLFRELVGNPFRPWRIQPAWLAPGHRTTPNGQSVAVTAAALDLATDIDRRRRFDLLPLLADELESTGWSDPAILHHCRYHPTHLRGCWAVDVVLGRE